MAMKLPTRQRLDMLERWGQDRLMLAESEVQELVRAARLALDLVPLARQLVEDGGDTGVVAMDVTQEFSRILENWEDGER
jgi:hypothetical protein